MKTKSSVLYSPAVLFCMTLMFVLSGRLLSQDLVVKLKDTKPRDQWVYPVERFRNALFENQQKMTRLDLRCTIDRRHYFLDENQLRPAKRTIQHRYATLEHKKRGVLFAFLPIFDEDSEFYISSIMGDTVRIKVIPRSELWRKNLDDVYLSFSSKTLKLLRLDAKLLMHSVTLFEDEYVEHTQEYPFSIIYQDVQGVCLPLSSEYRTVDNLRGKNVLRGIDKMQYKYQ